MSEFHSTLASMSRALALQLSETRGRSITLWRDVEPRSDLHSIFLRKLMYMLVHPNKTPTFSGESTLNVDLCLVHTTVRECP